MFSSATSFVTGSWPDRGSVIVARTRSRVRPSGEPWQRLRGQARVAAGPPARAEHVRVLPPRSARLPARSGSAARSGSHRRRRQEDGLLLAEQLGRPPLGSSTVGSPRFCSSPTTAFVIASRIPFVGSVSVSERSSITRSLWQHLEAEPRGRARRSRAGRALGHAAPVRSARTQLPRHSETEAKILVASHKLTDPANVSIAAITGRTDPPRHQQGSRRGLVRSGRARSCSTPRRGWRRERRTDRDHRESALTT